MSEPCCNPAHLFLGTVTDNNHDRDAKGRAASTVGELNRSAKLTEADVHRIRELLASGRSDRSIAREYHMGPTSIGRIRTGRAWRSVSSEPTPEKEPVAQEERLDVLDQFVAESAVKMRERLEHGRRKFGHPTGWRAYTFSDKQNAERLDRAVEHLQAARRNSADPAEWAKRAADVANLAFMYADPKRRARRALTPEPPQPGEPG